MGKVTLKGVLLMAMFVMSGCLTIYADDDGLITRQVVIRLDQAGTLPDKIADVDRYRIAHLKIVGKVNGTDLRLIRDMAGRNYANKATEGKLATLDLAEAKIVEGGEGYLYVDNDDFLFTSNDVIPVRCFHGCSSLSSVIIPSSVTEIGGGAFYGCSGLINVTIPPGVTKIGDCTFMGCSGLVSVAIPLGVVEIGEYAFFRCSSLTSAVIPLGVTEIKRDMFYGCGSLTSVVIPSSVIKMDAGAFCDCSSLACIDIPDGVTEIGANTFYGCSSLASVAIPSGVTKIGYNAFYGCSNLTGIAIPSKVTEIDTYAFYQCCALRSVYVARETPLSIDNSTFYGIDPNACTLYVPQGTGQAYRQSVWSNTFSDVREYDVTGLDEVTTAAGVREVARYGTNGQRVMTPVKGLNIVKYSDGSTRKVIIGWF